MFSSRAKIKNISITFFLFLILLSPKIFSQVDTTFGGLRGYEDLNGNTQLFYRFKSDSRYTTPNESIRGILRNDIFHFDINENIDSLFILDYLDFHTPLPTIGTTLTDFEFVDNTLTNFYQCGDGVSSFEPSPVVVYNRDYNHSFGVNSFHGETSNMEIVRMDNKHKVYVSTNDGVYTESLGKYELENSTASLTLVSINKAEPNLFFVNNEDGYLLKSIDTGKTFAIVDTTTSQNLYNDIYWNLINRKFLYDSDGIHIYRIVQYGNKCQLLVSNNKGELNSWTKKYESESEMFISIDSTHSGLVFIGTGTELFKSENFGETFQLLRELNKIILGIYKKPNSELIYATTPHSLLEITPGSTKIIKYLIDYAALNFYPLHVGDTWVYSVNYDSDFDNEDSTYFATTLVTGIETINGKEYFKIDDAFGERNLLRIDSANAILWEYSDGKEILLDSLSCSKGDVWGESFDFECVNDSTIYYFNQERRIKEIRDLRVISEGLGTRKYTYAEGLGRIFYNRFEINVVGANRTAGLVYAKVNGVEYGDSTFCENKNIYFSEKKLNLFWNEFNPVLADTTWLINKSAEILMVDSVINNHGYSYRFDVLFSDSNSNSFSLLQNYMDIVAFSVNAYDSVQIVLSNPDLCPICDGSSSTKNFTDSLHIYTNSEKIPVLLLAVEGDGTLDAENINTENITFALQQNYPNPFNPSTVIRYSIPHSTEYYSVQHATLKVFDILGREVATLVNKHQKAGNYEVSFDASNLTSGIYLYRLQSGRMNINKKMILIK